MRINCALIAILATLLVSLCHAQCPAFQINFGSGASSTFPTTPNCAADICQPGWSWASDEVMYFDDYCVLEVNGTSATAGEITSSCSMVPGQVSLAIANNIRSGSAVPGAVTDISIDTGDGAINLQLFGNSIASMRYSGYPVNGGQLCMSNGPLVAPSSSTTMFTISWGTSGSTLKQNGQTIGELPASCMFDMNKQVTLKIHVWGCNGQISECAGTPDLGSQVAATYISWINYSPW